MQRWDELHVVCNPELWATEARRLEMSGIGHGGSVRVARTAEPTKGRNSVTFSP